MRNNLLLLHFFSIFLNPQRVTLTYSAMTDGPIDVQLRWANLRAREHHVKGPKKLPRKMVLWRLILRKAEEAKRTTTWAPYRVQCPCLQCQNQPRWILPNFSRRHGHPVQNGGIFFESKSLGAAPNRVDLTTICTGIMYLLVFSLIILTWLK